MSGRPRHSQLGASDDPYKIWRPQERQVESDSERPRYRTTNTSQSQRNQEEGRYYSSSRGYKSDSPTTASASQHRSGPSSSKPLHHPSRPSVSNNYVSRSQQPAPSSSTTATPQVQHHPRSQPQRSQPETYSSRVYLHNQNASTPTPQSSHERVPTADEFTKASRSNPYSRTGYATQVPQPTSAPEVWLPPTHDPSLSRKPRDRDRERDRERDRDREKETARDRNRERERPKDTDRRRERDVERRDDVYRDPSRDVYRDRDRDKDRVRERERDKYQERRTEEEREPVSHRELRNTSKPTFTQDTRTRDPTTTSTSNHRRHRSEETPLSSATVWRPPIDSKQTSVTAPPAPKAAPAQTIPTGGQANVPPPTPRVMPVYLPAKQPSAYKSSHERSYSTPAALAQKENSTSDSEQPSRRDLQSRTVSDSRLATTTSTIKDNGISRSQKDQTDRPHETTPPKSKHEARYQSTRSKPLGTQPPSASVLKPLDVGENTLHASAKPQIVSIRAGQGPSDPQTSDALFKKSTRSIRENRPDVSEQPSTSIQLPSRVQEQVKRYEAFTPTEVLSTSTRVHTSNVEQNPRSTPTKAYPSQASAAPASQDRPQAREAITRADVTASSSSRAQASNVELNDRSRSTFQQPTHQPTSTNHDRSQSNEVFVRPEQTASTLPRAYPSGVEPNNRSELAPKPYTHQSASANSGLQQSNEASIKPDMMTSTPFRARTTDIETNHRFAPIPKPSLSQAAEAAPPNRLPKARTVRFDLPPPSPSPPPVATPIGSSMAPHTSRLATVGVNEARSSPILEPFVPPSSSGFRQTPTPPLQSDQKLSSSPQPKDLNALHLPRVIDRESLAPSAAHLPVTSSQPQATGGEMSSSPLTVPQASPARSVPSQVENRQAEVSQRSAERTLTSLAPPLTAVSSQSQSQSTPTSAQTTPSQSTSRSTKTSDAPSARQHDNHGPPVEQSSRQDALQADVRNQPPAPGPQISSAADQHRTIFEPPRQVVIASATESSSPGPTPSTAAPAVGTSPTMHPQSHAADTPPTRQEHVTHSQPAAGDAIQFPAVSSNHQKTHTYTIPQPEHGTGRQLQPSPEDARLPLQPAERSASVSGKGSDATIPGLNSHFSAVSVVQAHTQGNAIPVQSGGGHSRKNSIDVNTTRPIILHHAPTPQILVEDSPREIPRREVFPPATANMPQLKSLPPEPILSVTTSISTPQIVPALQTTISRDMPDNEILPEPRSARLHNNVPLTSANFTSTSASSQQPTIGSGSSKSRALLDEDLPSPHAFSHKKQDSSVSRDAAEDTVLLRNQLRDEPSQAPAMVALPVSHSTGSGQFRSSQDPTLNDASRTMPSRSWHQSAKQPERHSPRPPSVMDLPQSTIASTIKTEPHAVTAQQPVSARAVLQGSHPEDQGQWSGSFNNQRGGLPKTTLSAAKHVSQSVNPDELRSPQPLNPVASTPVKGDLHSKENADDHKAVRQRDQDDTTAPPTAFEKQRGDTYRSASRAPPGVTSFAQDPPPRFPVVEDVMQRPSTTANRPERQKFSYGPASTPALDPHHNLFSPVQQAIRAAPPPQIQPRSLSHDTQTSDLRSRGQTDVPSVMSSQHVSSRSQPYSTAPIPAPTASSVPPSQSSNSAPMSMRQWTSVNPYAPSRLDESITPQRTTQPSAYPPASRYPTATTYPTASNRSDSQPTATPSVQQHGPQNAFLTSASQQAARYAPSVQYPQSPPVPDIPQSNFLSRASDAARKAPVNRVQAYPEPHSSAPNPTTFAQESTGTYRHNVSLTNVTSQPTAVPHLPARKSSSSSIKPPSHPAPPPPVSSSYYLRPDLQQPTVSTRVPVSGPSSSLAPSRSRLPSQPSRNTSKESILMTPSSLAPSMLPKTDHSRVPPMAPISRQESNQSKDSSKKKNGFLNMFRSKTPAQKTYEVWHPPAFDKQRNQSQSSLQSTTGKVPVLASSSSTIDGVASTSQRKAPAPIAVNLPLHPVGRKEPDQKVFSAFKFLHTKRNRTVSHASVEAQDGQTQTATNTVVGSPTQSNRSQPFAPPPVRDPQLAAQEWRNREEAEMRSRAKRRRPGVVFDIEEDPPEPPPGTVPKKKLSRRRQ